MAVVGYTVATTAAVIATWLAAQVDTPEFVMINLGTNDAAGAQTEATWKANYRTIINAVHTKWPAAPIYLAKPVRLKGAPPNVVADYVAPIHGYIDALIAEQVYLHAGLDETSLENGDGYVTYFADFAHPNDAGYKACADGWKTILGY